MKDAKRKKEEAVGNLRHLAAKLLRRFQETAEFKTPTSRENWEQKT